MNPDKQAVIDRVNASPFNQAVDRLIAAVRLVLPDAAEEDLARLSPAFGDVLTEALSQVAQTGAATVVAVSANVDALRDECRRYHDAQTAALAALGERIDAFTVVYEARLRTLEAGGK